MRPPLNNFEIRTHVAPDGTLIVRMPSGFADSDVRVVVERTNGQNGAPPPPVSRKDRDDALNRLSGSIDDPTFTRHALDSLDDVEPLD